MTLIHSDMALPGNTKKLTKYAKHYNNTNRRVYGSDQI